MSAAQTIRRVIAANILAPELSIIPDYGASAAGIANEEGRLRRSLSLQHRDLLSNWNGLALEVIRFFGCGSSAKEIGRLGDLQLNLEWSETDYLVIGSDASGFVYIEASTGEIYSLDTEGMCLKLLARDLDDFVGRVVFGSDAAQFAGDDWLQELRNAGLIT
jgi:hypothetical protein